MISLESIILLAVIGLVLFIDKFFSKKQEYINGELVIVTNKKKKNYFALEKSNIIYWFPLVFLIIGLFISDKINLSIYEQTGFIYDSLAAWSVIFYYVTFFSYKSLSIVKTKNKLIATEILYFFTIIFLSVLMHFSTQNIQKSDNAFVTNTSITTEKSVSCNKKFQEPWSELEKQKEIIIRRYIGKVFDGFKETGEINDFGLPVMSSTYRNDEVCDFEIVTYTLYDYREPIIQIKSDNSYFIPFLINLLIIGYVWRLAFMLIVWSINIILKE